MFDITQDFRNEAAREIVFSEDFADDGVTWGDLIEDMFSVEVPLNAMLIVKRDKSSTEVQIFSQEMLVEMLAWSSCGVPSERAGVSIGTAEIYRITHGH